MDIILAISVVALVFHILMFIRNEWVFRWQIRFINAVHDYEINAIKTDWDDYESLEEKDTYCHQIKMLLMFWVWDYKKFIYDDRINEFIDLKKGVK